MVGAGGREHAIVRALGRSPQAPEILCAPGNPGIERDATLLPIPVTDVPGLVAAAREHAVDLVVVGPEAPLVAGLVDALADAAIPAFGPTAAAARVEGSKVHAKELMAAAGVPTGAFAMAATVDDGLAAIGGSYPAVLKYDGLAAGKGVVIAEDEDAARRALEDFLVHRSFGDGQVFVEEHLTGEELSLLALCDGERAIPMAPAQDFKRIGDGDVGPNTGGMGSYSPVPGAGDAHELSAIVHQPLVDELRRRGTPFHGVLYAGLMLTPDGPRVIEYNARFGDPETQAVLPRLRSDLLELLRLAASPGGLEGATLDFTDERRGHRRPGERRLSGVVVQRRRHLRPRRRGRRRRAHARGDRAARRRRDRDRRRAGTERHGVGSRHRGRPRRGLCCRGSDHLRGPSAAP